MTISAKIQLHPPKASEEMSFFQKKKKIQSFCWG